MAQKINPISLRLKKTNRNFDSSWFNDSNYVNLLMRDFKIQSYTNIILKKLKYCSARYLIQNLPNKVKITIFFCNADKDKKHMCKIFYLNYTKKIKKNKTYAKHKSVAKFFNISQTGISFKQGKIFTYLIKNFNNNLLKNIENFIQNILLNSNSTNLKKNNAYLNNYFLIKNYLKLTFSIKVYNQFCIRYFLIKYFSFKFPMIAFNEKNFHFSFISPTYENTILLNQNYAKHIFFRKNKIELKQKLFFKKQSTCAKHKLIASLKKKRSFFKQNILFFYIMNFLFFKIYKNKNFLALNKFLTKIDNYKLTKKNSTILFSELIKKNKSVFSLKKTIIENNAFKLQSKKKKFFLLTKYSSNFLKQKIFNNFTTSLCKTQVLLNLNDSFSPIFFFNNVEITKLKILNFLKKLNSKSTCLSKIQNLNIKNENLGNFSIIKKHEKKCILNFNNFSFFIKLKSSYKNFQWCNNKNQYNNFLFKQKCLNKEYYNISLINNQCFNQTYTNYCKLSESYKYYNTIFSHSNLHPSYNLIKNNKKLILLTSPYKNHMESVICNHLSFNINFHFFQTKNIFQNASFFIDEIIYYLEKKVPFFKIKNYILKKLTEMKFLRIKGIRVTCSGRIKGKSKKAQRSKIQNFKYGETSLHVFSSKIDFKSKNAFTSLGTLGVKTWICYN